MSIYKVIIVDDEPASLSHLCAIIEKKCPDYDVITTAENGQEALDKVREYKPDLVISDVKMPLMSGVELAGRIKEEIPDTHVIIVSGYQDFSYVQGALREGVCDYILKPIMPQALMETVDKVTEKLKTEHYHMRNRLVKRLCTGMECEEAQIKKYFPYERYYRAIIRNNGLPRRFSSGGGLEIYSDINESMTIYGRDEMESLYLVPKEFLLGRSFSDYIQSVEKRENFSEGYLTIVYDEHSFTVSEFPSKVGELYRCLDTVSVVGVSQSVNLSETHQMKQIDFNHDEINHVLNGLEHLIKEKQLDQMKKELTRLYGIWEKEKKPQLWMEYVSRQILYVVRKHSGDTQPLIECEHMLEDAFYYATTSKELRNNLFDVFFFYFKDENIQEKVDSPEFFQKVLEYLSGHFDENITLHDLCNRFSVSQTYMSRLFRKYTQDSFSRYFTNMRMEKAKQLMQSHPQYFIKDVAALVGYADQFYFSRIFRSYTGLCPSDYMEEVVNE